MNYRLTISLPWLTTWTPVTTVVGTEEEAFQLALAQHRGYPEAHLTIEETEDPVTPIPVKSYWQRIWERLP